MCVEAQERKTTHWKPSENMLRLCVCFFLRGFGRPFARILLRTVEPCEGSVKIDGVDLQQAGVRGLQT